MKNKLVRLFKALANESVKRLPWIFLIFLILLFAQFVRFNAQTAENTRIAKGNSIDTKTLLLKVAQLSEDNRRLTKQNIDLAKQNSAHLDCIATLFVHYTQNKQPIADYNLTTCTIVTKGNAKPSATASQPTSPQSSPSPSGDASSYQQPTTPSQPAQPNNSQSPPPNVFRRILSGITNVTSIF